MCSVPRINDQLSIDDAELSFTFARAGGPGGQNVNKLATSATLWWNVDGSASLSETQRATLRRALRGRIGSDGFLRVMCRRHRTQAANRRDAEARFVELLAEALRPRTPRRPTRPTASSQERRLETKARRSRLRRERGRRWSENED